MNQDDIFAAYYVQYRAEATTPNSSDDEYKIFTGLANEAINRWSNYDNTFWKELYNTLQLSQDGENVIVAGQTEYAAPDDMRISGGFLHLKDSAGVTKARLPIIEPQEAQFKRDTAPYVYFIGDPNNGFNLVVNGLTDAMTGLNMDYVYYKKPTTFGPGTTNGGDFTEMTQPYFIVHRALANRFRGTRNPYYQSAKTDAEDVLTTMQLENNSGNWANPWQLVDHSSGRFGA